MERIRIGEVTSEDYKELALFNSSFGNDARGFDFWLARLKHWWDENPAYDKDWVRGFILRSDTGIHGFIGSIPTWMKINGQQTKVFNGTTWRVNPDFRKHSIDLWDLNRSVSDNYLSLNTTGTEDVRRLLKVLRYCKLPNGPGTESFILLRPNLVQSTQEKHSLGTIKSILAHSVSQINRKYIGYKRVKGYNAAVLTGKEDDVNTLWHDSQHQYLNTNVRTKECVQWLARGILLVGVYRSGRLVAYAICMVTDRSTNQFGTLRLVDLWYIPECDLQSVLIELTSFFIKYGFDNELSLIRIPHFTATQAIVFSKLGLLSKSRNKNAYYKPSKFDKITLGESESYFTLLQGDYGA